MSDRELSIDEIEALIDGDDEVRAELPMGRGVIEVNVRVISIRPPGVPGDPALVRCFLTADDDFRIEGPHTMIRRSR